jgi:pimeloyl-ACP methyl ester carboxylesterase
VIPPRLRRNALRLVALLFFIVLAGATYQGVATALERREYPRPGGMVKAGSHQLHLSCPGVGSPIVVLEAGVTGMSSAWGWVQTDIEKVTRVCSYDRAGLGWSEWGQEPFSADAVAVQLDTLLQTAGENPPYVMVGHGLGAAFASIYAGRFPTKVHSLVLLDSPIGRAPLEADTALRMAEWWPWLARTGVLRATRMLSRQAAGLPAESAERLATFLNRPDHLTRALVELRAWDDVVRQAAATTVPEEIPVSRVDVTGLDRIALPTDPTQAAAAAAAILTAVAGPH